MKTHNVIWDGAERGCTDCGLVGHIADMPAECDQSLVPKRVPAKTSNGYILFEGPSALDGKPIVVKTIED